jgi:hypothetical protein
VKICRVFFYYEHTEVQTERTLEPPMIKMYKNSYEKSGNCEKITKNYEETHTFVI